MKLDETFQYNSDQTSQRLQHLEQIVVESNHRLDLTLIKLEDFQIEVSKRFDGVGSYLKSINGTLHEHGHDLTNLKERVQKLENEDEGE